MWLREPGERGRQAFDATNEIIRRITRYAAQLSEKNALGANRREEYRKVAEIFLKCENLQEAHRMSAMVFGLEKPFHLKAAADRETDSMNQSVYEEPAAEILYVLEFVITEKNQNALLFATMPEKRKRQGGRLWNR